MKAARSWLAAMGAMVIGVALCPPALADHYKDAVLELQPDHYYQLDETTIGPPKLDGDGLPIPVETGAENGIQYDSPVEDTGSAPTKIPGFHEGKFEANDVDPGFAEVGVCGPPVPGFNASNRALLANNRGSVNLGPGENFGAPEMTVAFWFRVPCTKDPEAVCEGPPGSDGGDRLFTNNSPDRLDHFQLVFGWGANLVVSIDPNASSPENARQIPHGVLKLKNGQWHHVVASRGGNEFADVKIIVDGVDYTDQLVDSTDSWGTTGGDAHIASRPGGNFHQTMNGEMDEVAVWLGTQLSVEEAQELYAASQIPDPPVNNYTQSVLELEPDHYYQLDEAVIGPPRLDGDGLPVPVATGAENGIQYDSPVEDTGSAPTKIPGFHEGKFEANDVDPAFAEVGVCGPPLAGFSAANKALKANNRGSVNLGPGENFGAPEMTVAFWFRVPCTKDPEAVCEGPPGSDGGDRLFTNNSPDRLDHFQLVFGWGANLVLSIDPNASSPENARQIPHGVLKVKNGQWHHVVASRGGNEFADVKVIVDGVDYTDQLVDSTDSWGTTGGDAHIASRPGGNFHQTMNGEMDDFAVWLGRQLTVEEAEALYESALTEGDEPPLTRVQPGDINLDGKVDLSDPVTGLGYLFLGSTLNACLLEDGAVLNEAGLKLGDWNGDGGFDLSDAVASLTWQFASGTPHALGEACVGLVSTCTVTCGDQ